MKLSSRVENRSVQDRLDSVSWDFADASARSSVHSLHPYPARFIGEIPRTLIELFTHQPSAAILDPFCGSGTTLVEAQDAGIPSIGIDLHPLACLISGVKTRLPTGDILSTADEIAGLAMSHQAPVPEIPRLDHWFRPDVQRALASLVSLIQVVPDSTVRDALRVALSRIIVRVSNQESDTRYAAVDKQVSYRDVIEQFARSARVVGSTLELRFGSLLAPEAEATVINADIREAAIPEGVRVELIITSPPYPNAFEYWLYHKYRMYWLGMDPLNVRAREIGARPHYFKRNPHTAADFELAMRAAFSLIQTHLVPGGLACFLVGTSVIRGEIVDNIHHLQRAAQTQGFELVGRTDRAVNANRKSFNRHIGRLQRETVAVFRLMQT